MTEENQTIPIVKVIACRTTEQLPLVSVGSYEIAEWEQK